jgi:hypothetical protein
MLVDQDIRQMVLDMWAALSNRDWAAVADARASRGMALGHRRIRGAEVRHRAQGANADMSWVFDATGLV